MTSKDGIVAWKCHICGGEFEFPYGGFCGQCGKPTFTIGFAMEIIKSLGRLKYPGESPLCRACAKSIKQEPQKG